MVNAASAAIPEADPAHLRRLALLLAFPEADALAVLHELVAQEPWLAEPIAELEAEGIESWQAEYTRLLLSGYPKTPCPPYESAYREGKMHGNATQALEDLYRRAGLEIRSLPADYLGAQLEFAAYLMECAAAQTAGSVPEDPNEDLLVHLSLIDRSSELRKLAAELWEGHLCQWVPRLAADLRSHARLLLYRRLGERLNELCARCRYELADP